MRLINADKLIQRIVKGETSMNRNPAIYTSMITEDLYVDAEPVRHGHWIMTKGINGNDYRKCSNCLHTQPITGLMNYCPICGAKMYGETDDTD
jgi:hypothetical protein